MRRLFSALIERHVPQVVGLYVAALWGLVQFVDWLVEEFVLSPHLPGFVFLLGLLLIPCVALLTWRLGGEDESSQAGLPVDLGSAGRFETAGVLLNLLIAGAVLFVTYGGRDLGSATREVRLVDEAGDSVQAQVPKQEFIQDVLLFHLDNETGDEQHDWISYAATLALFADLKQDPFVQIATQWDGWYDYQAELTEKGFPAGTPVPLALKRDLAGRRQGVDHFLAGSFEVAGTTYRVQTQLYETATGRLLASQEFSGDSLLTVLDEVAESVRRDLGLPSYELERSADLPVSEVLTSSVEALRAAALSMNSENRGETEDETRFLEEAVSADPTFAWANERLAYQYLDAGDRTRADSAMVRALRYLYRLPEREQLLVRIDKYREFDGDFAKALRTAEYMVEVYPSDLWGYHALARLYMQSGQLERAARIVDRILELDPSQHIQQFYLGARLNQEGRYQEALDRFHAYTQAVPDQPDGYIWQAWNLMALGKHEDASNALRRAEVIGTDSSWVYSAMSWHALDLGDFDAALEYRKRSIQAANDQGDEWDAEWFRDRYHTRLGRFQEALEAYGRQKELISDWGNISMAETLSDTHVLQHAARFGRASWALAELDSLSRGLTEPHDLVLAGPSMIIHLEKGDTVAARAALERVKEGVERFEHKSYKYHQAFGEARLAELRGDCRTALDLYEKGIGLFADSRPALLGRARCLQSLGQLSQAASALSAWLRAVPADPYVLLQQAELYAAMDRPDEAKASLGRALEIWGNADPEFAPARDARSLANRLRR